jgi:hypothetical protein
MGAALVPLQNITLGSTATSVTFASIPATYKDLKVVMTVSRAAGSSDVGFELNGDAGTVSVYMAGFGSSTGSGTASGILTYVSNTPMFNTVDILDYSATDKHKPGITRYGGAGIFTASQAFRWPSLAAVTSVRFYLGSGSFDAGSTFALYGVVA